MKRLICCIVGLMCLIGACANNENNETEQLAIASASAPSQISQQDAQKFAKTHLALKQWSWGDPQEVEERKNKFYIYYKTPQRERRLIGSRVLIVDKRTGVVSMQKRR